MKAAISLIHTVALAIADENFDITIRRENEKDKQAFEALHRTIQREAHTKDKSRKAFEKKQKLLGRNRTKHGNLTALYSMEEDPKLKKQLLLDRMKLEEKIEQLEDEIESSEPVDLEKEVSTFDFDSIAKKRFERLVGGEDKKRLEMFMSENLLTYNEVISTLNVILIQEITKKLKS